MERNTVIYNIYDTEHYLLFFKKPNTYQYIDIILYIHIVIPLLFTKKQKNDKNTLTLR